MNALFSRSVFVCFALAFFSAPAFAQMQTARNNAIMQQVHAIGIAMFSYANDNNGAYPTGNSSTEVFQKLMDGGYVTDPKIFFVQMPGKIAPTVGKLKPENVCFDVTVPVDMQSSDMVPLVYLTGYRLSFTPGSSAQPVSDASKQIGGMVIFYKSNSTVFIHAAPDGSAPKAIPPTLNDVNAAHYKQVTPEGSLQVNV